VNGDVVQIIDRGLELLRVQENILTNEKMGRPLVILDEEVVESVRRLKRDTSTRGDRLCNEEETNWQRAIVKAECQHAGGSVPNITRSDALVRRGTDSGAIGIITRGVRWVVEIGGSRQGNIWYLSSQDGTVQRVDPCLRHVRGRGKVGGKASRPVYSMLVITEKWGIRRKSYRAFLRRHK